MGWLGFCGQQSCGKLSADHVFKKQDSKKLWNSIKSHRRSCWGQLMRRQERPWGPPSASLCSCSPQVRKQHYLPHFPLNTSSYWEIFVFKLSLGHLWSKLKRRRIFHCSHNMVWRWETATHTHSPLTLLYATSTEAFSDFILFYQSKYFRMPLSLVYVRAVCGSCPRWRSAWAAIIRRYQCKIYLNMQGSPKNT